MLYVSEVQSNLKVGADARLGPRTLIVGPNGSGKTTIVNSIELALTARAGDVAGKDSVAVLGELLALAPGREGELWSTVTLSTGELARFRMHGKDGRASLDEHSVPGPAQHEGVLPVRTLADAFSSVDKARRFLVARAGGVAPGDILEMLPAQMRPLYTETVKAIGTNQPGSAAADLRAVIDFAVAQRKVAKAEAKKADAATENTQALPVSEMEVTTANKALVRARERLANHRAAKERNERRTELDARIEEVQAQGSKALAAVTEAGDVIELQGRHDRAAAIILLAERAAEKELDKCPLCLQAVKPEVWAKNGATIRKAVAKLPPIPGAELTTLLDDYEVLCSEREDLGDPETYGPGESEVILQGAIKSAEAFVSALAQRQEAWNAVQAQRTQGFGHAATARQWEDLENAATKAATIIVNRAAAAFESAVQANLPAGDVFRIRLGEGTRDVVRYGFERHGVLHTALSGAEWARMTAAFAMAITDGGFAVIIPEERAWDPMTLRDVMVALSDSIAQVILCSPIKPAGRLPKGWTLVETTRSVDAVEDAAAVADAEDEVRRLAEQFASNGTLDPVAVSAGIGLGGDDGGEASDYEHLLDDSDDSDDDVIDWSKRPTEVEML